MIERPDITFDPKTHSYFLNGKKLLGVSTVAKIGEEPWGPASWWGFKLGYEGAYRLYEEHNEECHFDSPEDLRKQLTANKATPNHVRDKAAARGTWVHDVLEGLALRGEVDIESFTDEVRPYVQAAMRWYLDFRPKFEAVEVQVVSEKFEYAGRYDMRITIPGSEGEPDPLLLVDLKTSKRIYPESHFVQLAGYELASVEMGFPPSNAQYVLNCKETGKYEFVESTALPQDFIAYLNAEKAKKRIKQK